MEVLTTILVSWIEYEAKLDEKFDHSLKSCWELQTDINGIHFRTFFGMNNQGRPMRTVQNQQ